MVLHMLKNHISLFAIFCVLANEIPECLSKICKADQNLFTFLSRKKNVKNMWQKYSQEFINFHKGTVAKFLRLDEEEEKGRGNVSWGV